MAISRGKTTATRPVETKVTDNQYDAQIDTKPAETKAAAVGLAPSDRAKEIKPKATQPKVATAKTTTTKKEGKAVVSETTEVESVAVTEAAKPDPVVEKKATTKKEKAVQEEAKKEESKAAQTDVVGSTIPAHLDPNGVATVSVSGSRTINLGNFESAKIEVYIAVPTALADINATHKFAVDWVEGKLDEAAPSKQVVTSNPHAQPRTVIHGDSTPVATNASARPPSTTARPPATTAKEQAAKVIEEVAQEYEQETPQQPANASARPQGASVQQREVQVGDTGTRVPQDGEVLDPIHDPNFEWHENL
ncbi:MAG: hypothetical protein RR280_01300 [Bacteroidaceae bacterium]